jgi:hypothetical protein
MKRDFMGICMANLLGLGALSDLAHFFEIPHSEEEEWGGTAEEMAEYTELVRQLNEAWDQEIKHSIEMGKQASKEKRHLIALKTGEKRRANKAR